MPDPWSLPRWRAYVAAAVLCYINLLNYMNWFIIAGEEGDRHPGQPLPICPPGALPPAGAACPWRPFIQQAFSSWSISLLSSSLAIPEWGEGQSSSQSSLKLKSVHIYVGT